MNFKNLLHFSYKLIVVCLVIFLAVSLLLETKTWILTSDFVSYLTGASILRAGQGELIYDIPTQLSHQEKFIGGDLREIPLPFRGLPFVGLFFIPLTYLPLFQGFRLFSFMNLGILVFFCFFISKTFRRNIYAFAIPLLFLPNIFNLIQAQISLVLTIIVFLIYQNLKKEEYFKAGLLSGLMLLKTQYLLLIPFIFLLLKDKKSYFYGVSLSFLSLILISIKVSGIDSLIDYPSFLINTENAAFGSIPGDMFSIYSLLSVLPFFKNQSSSFLLAVNVLFYTFLLYLFVKNLGKSDFNFSFISVVLFTVVSSIHFLGFDLSVLQIPIFILLKHSEKKKQDILSLNLKLVGLILFLLPLLVLAHKTFFAPLILLAIGIYLLKIRRKDLAKLPLGFRKLAA